MMGERQTAQEALFYQFSLERHVPADHWGRRCIAEGLVGGEGFAVDASLIKADANKQRSAEATEPVDWYDLARTRRSVREYLDTLDEAAWGEAKPKFVSRSDPAAQWTGALKGHAFFAYATNYLIDLDHAVIVDEASRAIQQAEVGSARTMPDRTRERFGLCPSPVRMTTGRSNSSDGNSAIAIFSSKQHGSGPARCAWIPQI